MNIDKTNTLATAILINCDMGEGMDDERIMPFIDAANIACGYHAGDVQVMEATIAACIKFGVTIGAHPSFHDRENFGRLEKKLSPNEIYELITQQLIILDEMVAGFEAKLNHIKPHGALYNMSAKDPVIAASIAKATKDFDPSLILFGLSGSHSIKEAAKIGLVTANEVFADRSYQDDGSLTPRSQTGALIDKPKVVVQQVLEMMKGMVTTVSGAKIPIVADTVCIHGDGTHALEFAKAIQTALRNR